MANLIITPGSGAIILRQGGNVIVLRPDQAESVAQTILDVGAECQDVDSERRRQIDALASWDAERRGFYSWLGNQQRSGNVDGGK